MSNRNRKFHLSRVILRPLPLCPKAEGGVGGISVTGQASTLLPRIATPARDPSVAAVRSGAVFPPPPGPLQATAVRAERIFEGHAMRHLQRLPVLVRDEAGLDEEAVERPQPHRQRQQRRRPAGRPCGREGCPSRTPPRAAVPPPRPAPPRLPTPRCPGSLYSTDRRLRSRTAAGLRARTRASSPPAASIRRGGDTAATSFRSL